MLSSINGRISGSFFELPEVLAANEHSFRRRIEHGCTAVLNGTVTCAEIYADGYLQPWELASEDLPPAAPGSASEHAGASRLSSHGPAAPSLSASEPANPLGGEQTRSDYLAHAPQRQYVVCIDPLGQLKWSRNCIERPPIQPPSHVIEVVTDAVSDRYLAYLRGKNISYIFAGLDPKGAPSPQPAIDLPLLMQKLVSHFGIRRLLVTGGGILNWSLLEAGLMDELHLFIASAAEPDPSIASTFDLSPAGSGFKPPPGADSPAGPATHSTDLRAHDPRAIPLQAIPLRLTSCEMIDENTLHVIYTRKSTGPAPDLL